MTRIALTGGIASGKSTIGRYLEELGAVRFDTDQLAREVVEPGTAVLARIRDHFGDEVIAADGTLDRLRLGQRVFGHTDELAVLNGLVHPAVRALLEERSERVIAQNPDAVIVAEIPLLAETGRAGDWDIVIVADAPQELRAERLSEFRNLSRDEALRRIGSQAGDDARREIADVLIDTSGSMEETLEQTRHFWHRMRGGEIPAE